MKPVTWSCPVCFRTVLHMPVTREGRGLKTKFLVVDDDEALAEMIGIVLNNDGFETDFCYDGARANDMYRSVRPDPLLLDLMLPRKARVDILSATSTECATPRFKLVEEQE